MDDLQKEIVDELTVELEGESDFKAIILANKVKNAIREVKLVRNYKATNYTDEQINEDIVKFYSVIMNLARYDYNMLGAEGQTSHSENGITRDYVSRESLLANVTPFIDVL